MPNAVKKQFSKQLNRFFRLRGIALGDGQQQLINFLFFKLHAEGRIKPGYSRYNLTVRFILNGLSDFLKIAPFEALSLLKTRTTRWTLPYTSFSIQPSRAKNLIQRLAKRYQPKFKITKVDGTLLSPKKQKKLKQMLKNHDVSFSPVSMKSHGHSPLTRGVCEDGFIYEETMTTHDIAVLKQKTPSKNPDYTPSRIRVSRKENQHNLGRLNFFDIEDKKNSMQNFSFTVSKEDILSRIGQKRLVSQKQVMFNISAQEALKEIGVIMTEKQNGRAFHWAHRQGFSLNGAQVKENLDPMPAGSNYATLFKVEQPIKDLLLDENSTLSQVLVQGEVHFDDMGLVDKVVYEISNRETGDLIRIPIDAKNGRIPTLDEYTVASKVVASTFNH